MTEVFMIHLLGFEIPQSIRVLVMFLILLIYCVTLGGNLLIITLVCCSKTLHTPMYFFLTHLSISDVLLVSDVLPNMLHTVWRKESMMPLSHCITQFYFFAVADVSECLLLMEMSYDRYLAICKPLHYTLIMTSQLCWIVVVASWTLCFILVSIYTVSIKKLNFCGPNVIDHFYCDLGPILELSCTDTSIVHLEVAVAGFVCLVMPFFFVILSYIYILIIIFNIPSIAGKQKAFSTCSSHLTIVSTFYSTLFCVYLVPKRGQSMTMTKFLSLLYTVVTPLMNPMIYSLRNKELKLAAGALLKIF
ncbi:olfactory receptor 1468-like [Gastrophryne carolinensis]